MTGFGSESLLWQVLIEKQAYDVDLPTLRQWIREGRVLATDPVRNGSGGWVSANQASGIRDLFAPPPLSAPLPSAPPPPPPRAPAAPSVSPAPSQVVTQDGRTWDFRPTIPNLFLGTPVRLFAGILGGVILFLSVLIPIFVIPPIGGGGDAESVAMISSLAFPTGKVLMAVAALAILLVIFDQRGLLTACGIVGVIAFGFQLFLLYGAITGEYKTMVEYITTAADPKLYDYTKATIYVGAGISIFVSLFLIFDAALTNVPSVLEVRFDRDAVYGGFFRRLGATLLDGIWWWLLLFVILNLLGFIRGFEVRGAGTAGALVLVLDAVYTLTMWQIFLSTPGRMTLRLVILDAKTLQRPSFVQLVIRYFAYWASFAPALLGFFWVLFDGRCQSWHDKIAGTVVVRAE